MTSRLSRTFFNKMYIDNDKMVQIYKQILGASVEITPRQQRPSDRCRLNIDPMQKRRIDVISPSIRGSLISGIMALIFEWNPEHNTTLNHTSVHLFVLYCKIIPQRKWPICLGIGVPIIKIERSRSSHFYDGTSYPGNIFTLYWYGALVAIYAIRRIYLIIYRRTLVGN